MPEDIKIAGYSNDPRAEIITPSITSVDQCPALMGEKVAAALLELLQQSKPVQKYNEEIIPIELITRASTEGPVVKARGKKK